MSSAKIPLVFFGSGPVAAASLEGIIESFAIELVITKPRPSYHKEPAPVEVLAAKNSLPLAFAGNTKEVNKLLSEADLSSRVGLIIDFGVIVSEQSIKQFEMGLINSHFSLLPRWRGADPITYCLLEGDQETGVSLMKIVPKLDEGPLIAQEKFKIPRKINSVELTDRLTKLSNSMLKEYIPKYLNEELLPKPQSVTGISYSHKISKQDGLLDWNKSAKRLEQEIRAYAGWPQSRTKLKDIDCIITAADVTKDTGTPGSHEAENDSLKIFTSDGALSIKRIKPAGKKEMAIDEFLRGYRSRL